MENTQQFIDIISKIYHSKDEIWDVNGPFFIDNEPYWFIKFMRKNIFKSLHQITLIVLNKNGEIIKEWETYEKIVFTYLMPKISEKFAVYYSGEMQELLKMQEFFRTSLESIHGFRIAQLIEGARRHGVDELINLLESFVSQLIRIESKISGVLKHMENTRKLINVLLLKEEYRAMKDFTQNILFEKEGFDGLRKSISEQAPTIFYIANILRELGMRKDESRRFIDSINMYVSSVRRIRKKIDQMIKIRQFMLNIINEREKAVSRFYNEMLKRT